MPLAFHFARASRPSLGFDIQARSVGSLGAVEAHPVADDVMCLEAVGQLLEIDGLLFQ